MCALWTPDVRLRRGPALDVVEGVSGVVPERWGVPCSICGSPAGTALRCSAGHCTLPFHALCGRNAGLHLAARGAALTCLICAPRPDSPCSRLRLVAAGLDSQQFSRPDVSACPD